MIKLIKFVNRETKHDAMFPVKYLKMSRKAVVHGPNVHMEIGIAKRKNVVMMPGVKSDHFHRLVGDGKANFGFFLPFGIMSSPALIKENMEGRLRDKTIQ